MVTIDRYRIVKKLGIGGSATTYQAEDLETNKQVALKVLSLKQIDEWKKIELFTREADILKQLDHPQIPDYLDYFEVDTDDDRAFYLVQELADGQSLFDLVEKRWQPSESEVKKIAIQILEILIYLQSFSPSIFHRDIKPQNIIYGKDKKVYLVDFGAVQNKLVNTLTASTIVGTYGYMSIDQLRGKANLSTDLYGLGATLIYLLTQQHPNHLPQHKLKIQFKKELKTNISTKFFKWLNILIEPNSKKRFSNAKTALDVLKNKTNIDNYIAIDQPKYSSITIREKNEEKFVLSITPALFSQRFSKSLVFLTICWYMSLTFLWYAIFVSLSNDFSLGFATIVPIIYIIYGFYNMICVFNNLDHSYGLSKKTLSVNQKVISGVLLIFNILIAFVFFLITLFFWQNVNTIVLQITCLLLFLEFLFHFYTKNLKFYLLKNMLFKERLQVSKADKDKVETEIFFYGLLPISAINLNGKRYGHFLSLKEKHWLLYQINQYLRN